MKYLITGGAGFIGSNFIKYILNLDKDMNIINIDKLTYAGNLENLKEIKNSTNYTFIKEDICNPSEIDKIFNDYRPDYVINFAAESHVDRSIQSSEVFVKTNVLGTQILLQNSLDYGVRKYIQISTDEVYGSIDVGQFSEDSPLKPNNPYAASKAAGDLLTLSFFRTYGLPIIITRCSNNYGPHQNDEKFIPKVISKALNKSKIPIYGDGMNIRDWINVQDHCDAIYRVLHGGTIGEVYNISAKGEMANIDIAKKVIITIKEVFQSKGLDTSGISEDLIEFVTDRKGHDKRYGLDAKKLKNELGWEPRIEIDYGLKKVVEWYIDNNNYMGI